MHDQNYPVNRREFLIRAAMAAASIGTAGFITYQLRDNTPPSGQHDEAQISLPDFSIPDGPGLLGIARGPDRKQTLTRALKSLGGIGRFIKKDDRVLVKVNAAFATPPMLGATTHPDLLSEIIHLCFAAGAASVVVTDNPLNDPFGCFKLTGIKEAAERAGAKVMLPNKEYFRPTTLATGSLIRNWPFLYTPFEGVTKLIGTAPVKSHYRSGASMIMKNWYGLLGGRRNIFHQQINDIIKELAMLVQPTLVILDGTTTMLHNGPTGGSLSDLKQTNTMIVGTDQVAADAFGATLLGKTADQLPYIRKAAVAGAGTANYQLLNPKEVNGS